MTDPNDKPLRRLRDEILNVRSKPTLAEKQATLMEKLEAQVTPLLIEATGGDPESLRLLRVFEAHLRELTKEPDFVPFKAMDHFLEWTRYAADIFDPAITSEEQFAQLMNGLVNDFIDEQVVAVNEQIRHEHEGHDKASCAQARLNGNVHRVLYRRIYSTEPGEAGLPGLPLCGLLLADLIDEKVYAVTFGVHPAMLGPLKAALFASFNETTLQLVMGKVAQLMEADPEAAYELMTDVPDDLPIPSHISRRTVAAIEVQPRATFAPLSVLAAQLRVVREDVDASAFAHATPEDFAQ
jgi:hypothetical protein